jgi:hypothetical protein
MNPLTETTVEPSSDSLTAVSLEQTETSGAH